MRAMVIATGWNQNVAALNERYPTPLLPLVDRPFIQFLVEMLVEHGVTEFDFVLHHLPEKIEQLLGDGARWGCKFRFHLAQTTERPYDWLNSLSSADAPILLARADCLPKLPTGFACPFDATAPLWYGISATQWTGWAWLPPDWLAQLPTGLTETEMELLLRMAGQWQPVSPFLNVQSYDDLLAAQTTLLTATESKPLLSGHEAEAGIWISRNVSLPPTVRIIPPVFIGENCRVGHGVQLGPYAVVGHHCVLDERCTVTNSVVFPGTYVGASLELEDVLIDKNLLVNARLGAAIPVSDEFILGSLAETNFSASVRSFWSRLAAGGLLLALWPVLLLIALWLKLTRRGPVWYQHEAIHLPAPEHSAQWRTVRLHSFQSEPSHGGGWSDLLLRALPGLLNVAKGELRFVGVAPREMGSVKKLAPDWQTLYLRSKAGLVTEAEVQYGAHPNEDELYSAEAFYAATSSWKGDVQILGRYLGRLIMAPLYSPERLTSSIVQGEELP